MNCHGILKRSKRPGFHYWCAVNDRRGWADCVSFHALWMARQRASVCVRNPQSNTGESKCKRKRERGGEGDQRREWTGEPTPLPLPACLPARLHGLCLLQKMAEQHWGFVAQSSSSIPCMIYRSLTAQTWRLLCETMSLCVLHWRVD